MRKKTLLIFILIILIPIAYRGFYQAFSPKTPNVERPSLVDNGELLVDNIPLDEEEDLVHGEEKLYPGDPLEPTAINIDLLAVGDIMFHKPQIQAARIEGGGYDFNPVFTYVREYIENADLALANYETVTVSNREYSGYPRFNSPIETIQALKEAGFDILSTANNHSLDQGKEGIRSTIEAIAHYGLRHVGTNLDKDLKPLIVDVKGIQIGVMSYTYGLNGLESLLSEEELSYMVNLIDEGRIREEIKRLKEAGADIIISYIHWGNEYQHEPSQQQMSLGRKLVDWGVNIVLGSHPHVIQKAEILESNGKDNLILYSMGNFLSNQREVTMGNPYTEDGVMVRISLEKDMHLNETRIVEIEYIPTWVYRYSEGGRLKYEILPSEEVLAGSLGIDLDSYIMDRVKKSYRDVKAVLEDLEDF